MLRVEAPRLGYTRQFTIYDQADSRRLVKQCLDRVGRRPQALHAGRGPEPDLRRQEPPARRRRVPRAGRLLLRADRRRRLRALRARALRFNAMDFDDLLVRAVNVLELFPEVRERYQQAFRHVLVDEYQDTNHAQYRCSRCSAASGATSPSSATTTSPSTACAAPTSATSSTSRATSRTRTSSSSSRTTARRRRSSRPPTPSSRTTATRCARSSGPSSASGDPIDVRALADEHAEARAVLERDRAARRGGRLALGDRRLLPHQRAVAGARGRARARRGALPGDRRHEVLRARRDQGRDRLPVAARQPGRPGQLHARRQQPAARHRPDLALARDRLRGDARRARLGRRGRRRDGARAGPAAIKAIGRFMETMGELRALAADGVAGRASCSRRCCSRSGYLEALEAERTFEAQGRIENLEELVGVAREFDASAEERRLSTPSSRQIALVSDADTRTDDRGQVTLMTLHNAKGLEYPIVFIIGCEEGVFPHSRSLDEGVARGGAAALLRRHHARDARADADLRAAAHAVRRRELRAAQPLPRRDPGRADRREDASTRRRQRPITARAAARAAARIWRAAAAAAGEPRERAARRCRRSGSARMSSMRPSARAS